MPRNRVRPKRVPQFPNDGKSAQKRADDFIHDLMEFEDFKETILPAIRKDVRKGLTPKQLRDKYASLAQARLITEALTSATPAGQAAAKDTIDRAEGKATERKIVKHQYEDLSDQELNAILESEEQDLKDLEDRIQ